MIFNILKYSEFFYYIAGGIGLLLAGIGAIKGSTAWRSSIEERRINASIKELKSKYPVKKRKDTFKLIKSNANPVYVLDTKTKIIHWISSPKILHGAGYDYSMVEIVTQDEINSYEKGNQF